MKATKLLFTSIWVGLLLVYSLKLQGATTDPNKYEYLTIIQDYNEISITIGVEKFEQYKVKVSEVQGMGDYRLLLKKVYEYQEQGWEVIQNNVYVTGQGSTPRNYVMMRRVKQ